eukprot:scaffold1596_cov302-Pinguiococcus_pyrenoidosus.AAC.40
MSPEADPLLAHGAVASYGVCLVVSAKCTAPEGLSCFVSSCVCEREKLAQRIGPRRPKKNNNGRLPYRQSWGELVLPIRRSALAINTAWAAPSKWPNDGDQQAGNHHEHEIYGEPDFHEVTELVAARVPHHRIGLIANRRREGRGRAEQHCCCEREVAQLQVLAELHGNGDRQSGRRVVRHQLGHGDGEEIEQEERPQRAQAGVADETGDDPCEAGLADAIGEPKCGPDESQKLEVHVVEGFLGADPASDDQHGNGN